jgi:hypothetical protein
MKRVAGVLLSVALLCGVVVNNAGASVAYGAPSTIQSMMKAGRSNGAAKPEALPAIGAFALGVAAGVVANVVYDAAKHYFQFFNPQEVVDAHTLNQDVLFGR